MSPIPIVPPGDDHEWPADLSGPEARCEKCGLRYDQWTIADNLWCRK